MSEIHELLANIRKETKLSLREAAKRSGLSHSYIDSLEKGVHPKTKAPLKPSPDSLKALATAYRCSYIDLMNAAGYVNEEEYDPNYVVRESEIERVIREAEAHYGVNLRDDPDVNEALRELIQSLAKMKSK